MLALTLEKACFVIVKAREFDALVEVDDPDPGSNAADDGMRGVLEDYPDDPTHEELTSFLRSLNVDEQVELVALAWLGRGDSGADEWDDIMRAARDAHNDHTAEYLLGMPLLGDYLEEGLARLGQSCDEYKLGRL